MKFTVSWLHDHLATKASLEDLLDAMTNAGLEVERVEDPSQALSAFSVAYVRSVRNHPDADKLNVCTVDTKDGSLQIVCGAPNVRADMWVAYAPLGAYIPGHDMTLDAKPRSIRGVESHGMLCSSKELELGQDHDGIMDLKGDFKVGQSLASALGMNDPVIDFEVTPNRPDWLGVYGIARDLAAAGLGKFNPMPVRPVVGTFPCPVSFATEHTGACPVFVGRVIRGVRNGPSPGWMQARLKAVGINPKNMLIDVTNYLSIDRCRPLHAYDLSKLTGKVVARLGAGGETFKALDGREYTTTEDMCVIADDSGVIGLAGVMGGDRTAVSAETTDIFIESAYFDPDRTARTGRATGILSDARYRFERGVDPESCIEGVELATRLILECCGGEASEYQISGAVPNPTPPVQFNVRDMKRLTGVEVKSSDLRRIVKDLGFIAEDTGEAWYMTTPSWRHDIHQSADIVEEIIRIKGYNALPTTSLPPLEGGLKQVLTENQRRTRAGRRVLASRGFLETVTWSFLSKEEAKLFNGGDPSLQIANPVASDLGWMRPSILPNLIRAAQRNADFSQRDIRLFEAGPVYLADGPKDQRRMISGLVRPEILRHWSGKRESYGLYDAKADVFALIEALGQAPDKLLVMEPTRSHWHPGRSATLRLGPKNTVAQFGEIHPGVLKKMGIDGRLIGFEVNIDTLPLPRSSGIKTRPVLEKLDLTPVRRDFAFIVKDELPAGELIRAIQGADKAMIAAVDLFDVYDGNGVPDGHKSLAVEVTIQPKDATLTDDQIEQITGRVVKSATKIGATLRA